MERLTIAQRSWPTTRYADGSEKQPPAAAAAAEEVQPPEGEAMVVYTGAPDGAEDMDRYLPDYDDDDDEYELQLEDETVLPLAEYEDKAETLDLEEARVPRKQRQSTSTSTSTSTRKKKKYEYQVDDDEDPDEEMEDVVQQERQGYHGTGGDEDPVTMVQRALQTYDKLRMHYQRSEGHAHAHHRAYNAMKERNCCVNCEVGVGSVPGLEVGQLFLYKNEMKVVGLIRGSINRGIDHIKPSDNQWNVPVCTTVTLKGAYEDDVDDGETIVFTGSGGNEKNVQIGDQTLDAYNRSLQESCRLNLPVRVIRHDTEFKLYSYDGLYRVHRWWYERGNSDKFVYKFLLVRDPEQPLLGSRLVKYAGKLRAQRAKRTNVVSADISGGLESVPVVAVNGFDHPPVAPSGFVYVKESVWTRCPFAKPELELGSGCSCRGKCESGSCECVLKNGGELPYSDRKLFSHRPIIYECGPSCKCPEGCPNRVSQYGNTHKLEVFKTMNKGWGVRSWDFIPSGSFIGEYVGEVITSDEANERVDMDEYIFEMDLVRGNRNRGVDISSFFPEDVHGDEMVEVVEDGYAIDAAKYCNFTRFINHSCNPNVFVQCVFYDHWDKRVPHIMMFTSKHVRPFEELVYDYSYTLDSVHDPYTGEIKQKACYCGSLNCRKRLY